MNHRPTYRILFLSLIMLTGIITGSVSTAYSQLYAFRNYSIKDGLSQSVVNAIMQDGKGYMWVGSGHGLNKFDGLTFRNYFVDQGLIYDRVNALLQYSDGSIWIGTDRGISILKNGVFTNPDSLNRHLRHPVNDLYLDRHGNLWISTEGDGLFKRSQSGELTNYTTANGLSSNRVRKIVQDPSGVYWIATAEGINILHNNKWHQITKKDGLPSNDVNDLLINKKGSIWVATSGGLYHIRDHQNEVFTTDNGLPSNQINCIYDGIRGDLWIGTDNGLVRFSNGHFKTYTVENGLSSNTIECLMQDSEGNLWIGTYGGGMCRFRGERIINYTDDTGLSGDMITATVEDQKGNMWVGTFGNGLSIITHGKASVFKQNNQLVDPRIYSINPMPDGRLWIATGNGISVVTQTRRVINHPFGKLPFHKVRVIMKDNKGRYWIGSDDNGILIVNGTKRQRLTTATGLAGDDIRAIFQDTSGVVWIGTSEGLTRYEDGKMTNFSTREGLMQNGILGIFQDSKGLVWFAGFGGINVYKNGKIYGFAIKDGIQNNVCYTITQDKDQNYWIGTNKGIVKVDQSVVAMIGKQDVSDLDAPYIKRIITSMGLVSNEMNWNAIYRDHNGHIWFGSVSGLIEVNPSLDFPNIVGPPVHITGVDVMGEPMNPDTTIDLDYDHNYITIDYVGLCYSSPDAVLYKYRLRGIDRDWVTSDRRSVRYSALPVGDYVFEIRARNSDGIWSLQQAVLRFSVEPPFWRSWWFLSIVTMILLALIILVYNNYRSSKQIEIERMRVRIASDLHDDVGASLTEIALQTDFLQSGSLPKGIVEPLRQIGKQSREIVHSMDDIVWSIDARNDRLGDLTDRMQDYANRVLGTAKIGVKYDFDHVKNDKSIPVDVRQNLYLIFKEAVNNIAKHSGANRAIITFSNDKGRYRLEINDDGTGMTEAARKSGHGLRNMKMRAERIGASVEFKHNEGFTVVVDGSGI